MKQSEQVLLGLLRRSLFSVPYALPEQVNFEELFSEASAQSVLPLVWTALRPDERALIPSTLQEEWDMKVFLPLSFNEVVLYEQSRLLEQFEAHHIPYVTMKGSSVAANYPDPALRILGDIDIYVAPAHRGKAAQVLNDLGYQISMVGELHAIFKKQDVILELHRSPVDLQHCDDDRIGHGIEQFFSDLLEKKQVEAELPIPSDRHTAMLLILHKLGHFLSGELGLRQICDFAVFLQKRMTAELWQSLEPALSDFGLLTFTKVMAGVCIDHLGLPRKHAPWVGEGMKELTDEVMEQIMETGNFGRKAGNQYGQRLFVDASSKNRITSFFKVLGAACRSHWPVCETHPVLMSVAPFVVFGRYVKMRVQGKRSRLRVMSLYKRAGTRQKLYRELRPFVDEAMESKA